MECEMKKIGIGLFLFGVIQLLVLIVVAWINFISQWCPSNPLMVILLCVEAVVSVIGGIAILADKEREYECDDTI